MAVGITKKHVSNVIFSKFEFVCVQFLGVSCFLVGAGKMKSTRSCLFKAAIKWSLDYIIITEYPTVPHSLLLSRGHQKTTSGWPIWHYYKTEFLLPGMTLRKFDLTLLWPRLKKCRNEPSFVLATPAQHGLAPFLMAAIYLNRPGNRRFITPKGFAYASFSHYFAKGILRTGAPARDSGK